MSALAAVIKYGGHAMDDPALAGSFMVGLSRMCACGKRFALVHGGGPRINALLQRLQVDSHFVDGLRVTSPAVMEVVEMVLAGQVNKDVVTRLQRHGVAAVGICGKDGGLLQGRVHKPELGLVGELTRVDPRLVLALLDAGFLPVVAPVAMAADGASLNVNADIAAGALAGALKAECFVLLSDVPGVLDADRKLIPSLNRRRIAELRAGGVIAGGMIPKVEACLNALDAGCQRALILDGRAENSLECFLEAGAPLGTLVEA